MENKEIINMAIKARENAYAPYSNFKVGAAIYLKNGKYILGSNVENVSYGLSSCAERNTLFQAYNLGYKKEDILKIAIVSDTENPVSPCGACRQVMSELMNLDCLVILANLNGLEKQFTVKDLLPYAFEELK